MEVGPSKKEAFLGQGESLEHGNAAGNLCSSSSYFNELPLQSEQCVFIAISVKLIR